MYLHIKRLSRRIGTTLALCLPLLCPTALNSQTIDQQAIDRAKALVSQMTLREKIDYLSGETSFSLRAIPRLGIPRILLADGPVGLRNHAPHSTLYPASVLSAATWNRSLLHRLGNSLGDDARARGVSILLGPGVNITRSPLCGRNYEYFGEDPYLTGELALQYIEGLQQRGVMATIKHFAGNNQEWSRHHVSSEIDERTLNEIYFPAFRKAVEQGHVGAVMDSYNLLNGVHSTENNWLNNVVLRQAWGFKGILMSDWTSVYSIAAAANWGIDLEMPKGKYFNYDKLKPLLESGVVDTTTINLKVQHLLQTLIAFGLLDRTQKDSTIALDCPTSRQTALELAREGIVLLKNNNELPLKGTVALVGPNANRITTGGGSGNVVPFSDKPLDKELKRMNRNTILLTDDIIYTDITPKIFADSLGRVQGFTGRYYANKRFAGKPVMTRVDSKVDFDWGYGAPTASMPVDTFSVAWEGYYSPDTDEQLMVGIGGDDGYRISIDGKVVAGDWGNHSYSARENGLSLQGGHKYKIKIEFFDNQSSAIIHVKLRKLDEARLRKGLQKAGHVVYCGGFDSSTEGEGFDRPFGLPAYQQQFIKQVAAINPHLTVVLNAGAGVDMTPWMDQAAAIVMAWYPGQEGGTALAEILTGRCTPSGKLPVTFDRRWEDNPCHDSYYANEDGREVRSVAYNEGIFMGYRGYDRLQRQPLFPFGFGLSYTTFAYSNLQLEALGNDSVRVSFTITNTGKREGKEIAQVYVRDEKATVVRPEKELKGFEKVALKPGQRKTVSVTLGRDAFSFYDIHTHQWTLQPGAFTIMVGSSSRDIKLQQQINL